MIVFRQLITIKLAVTVIEKCIKIVAASRSFAVICTESLPFKCTSVFISIRHINTNLSTHTETCSYCEFYETVRCEFPDYVDNGDGSYTATCPTCNNTDTVDASQLFVIVRTEDELREAASVDGTKIRLGADIDVLDCIYVDDNTYVEIDMAGYSINCDDPSLNEFFVYGSLRIYDSVGGSSITNGFNTYDGTYLKVGNIKLKYYDPIGMKGTIDLSEYRGGELKMYVADFTDLIIPEGYGFYQEIDDEVIPDFEAAKEAGWVRIVPTN
jgi:hypothetical protein